MYDALQTGLFQGQYPRRDSSMTCVESVTVSPGSTSIKAGNWYYGASAQVLPSTADCTEVTWHSNNTAVATVNASSGHIYAKAPGTARIYATATDGSGCSDYIQVTVYTTVAVESVDLNRTSLSLKEGDSATLTAWVCPENATNKSVNWHSSNNSVATVSGGVVTAVSQGSATITATAADGSGRSASCSVTVTGDILVNCIEVCPCSLSLVVDQSDFLEATVCPVDATNPNIVWSSSNTAVATVNPTSGFVIAKSPGDATIYATAQDGSGVAGTCSLTVTEPVLAQKITLNKSYLDLYKGDYFRFVASFIPSNTTNKSVYWSSSKPSVVCIDSSTGEAYACRPGDATVCACAEDGSDVYAYCMITVYSADPFDESNIQFVRIKKIPSKKTTNGIIYTDCEITTAVTQSSVNNLTYFTALFHSENQVTTFEINDTLINKLQSLEHEYQTDYIVSEQARAYHSGKLQADILVRDGVIDANSPEYYGVWAYDGNAYCQIGDRIELLFAIASICYSGFMYGFTTVLSMQAAQMSVGQTKTITHNSYVDVVQSQKAIADITDDIAVQMGKTDITTVSGTRRWWRDSEMRVAEIYPSSDGYLYNKSFKIIDGSLVEVPHGTAGSQRPDFYNPASNHIVEVKNYTITTSNGRNNLANNIATQYNNRVSMFSNASIEFKVDVYGQAYTQDMLNDILNLVESSLGNRNIVQFITN